MNTNELLMAYRIKFKRSAGLPFHGFRDQKKAKEYWDTIQKCLDTGVPLTQEQRFDFGIDVTGDVIV